MSGFLRARVGAFTTQRDAPAAAAVRLPTRAREDRPTGQ